MGKKMLGIGVNIPDLSVNKQGIYLHNGYIPGGYVHWRKGEI